MGKHVYHALSGPGNQPVMDWKISRREEIQTGVGEHSVQSPSHGEAWHYPGFNLDCRRTTEYRMAMVQAFIRGVRTSSEMSEMRTVVIVK